MKLFPNTFSKEINPIDNTILNENDKDLLNSLKNKGYYIYYGLTTSILQDILTTSLQPSIKQYCPNDSGKRFIDIQSATKWLSKGRLTFLLMNKTDEQLLLSGYGWSGVENNSNIDNANTTFAVRISESGQGKGLAAPFARLIIAYTSKLYGANNFWLETWQSNGAAVHIYHKLGFEDVTKNLDKRQDLNNNDIQDTRLYMKLPNNLL